jgi:hypothetical protein
LKILGIDLFKILGWIVIGIIGYILLKSEITGNWNVNLSNIVDFKIDQDRRNSKKLRLMYIFDIIIIVPVLLFITFKKKTYKHSSSFMGALILLILLYNGLYYGKSKMTGN